RLTAGAFCPLPLKGGGDKTHLVEPAMPPLSVILPNYNHAGFLPRALDAVLGQSFADFELVAVDDGSTDGSVELLDDYARRGRRVRPRPEVALRLVPDPGGRGPPRDLLPAAAGGCVPDLHRVVLVEPGQPAGAAAGAADDDRPAALGRPAGRAPVVRPQRRAR